MVIEIDTDKLAEFIASIKIPPSEWFEFLEMVNFLRIRENLNKVEEDKK